MLFAAACGSRAGTWLIYESDSELSSAFFKVGDSEREDSEGVNVCVLKKQQLLPSAEKHAVRCAWRRECGALFPVMSSPSGCQWHSLSPAQEKVTLGETAAHDPALWADKQSRGGRRKSIVLDAVETGQRAKTKIESEGKIGWQRRVFSSSPHLMICSFLANETGCKCERC